MTVENMLVLPRIAEPASTAVPRKVVSVTTAPSGFEGEGFPVRRAFAGVDLRHLDPFIHMDQMGEVEYAPGEPKGTPWHPHRGFETVTYLLDGTFRHQDSNGGGGLITDGDTQWMTAGSGLLHIEAPPEELVVSGGLFHGFQLWVNLPKTLKMATPRYQDIRAGQVSLLTSADGGVLVRVIAGELDGLNTTQAARASAPRPNELLAARASAPRPNELLAARASAPRRGPGITHTPISLIHATLEPGAKLTLPWRPDFNALVYTLAGAGSVGENRQPVKLGQLAVFGAGDTITIEAAPRQESRSPKMDVLILGGQPIREPIAAYGPFVMNTKAELMQAFEDFQAGRLGVIPAE
jgi:quercetin 2,3-dioxygenase